MKKVYLAVSYKHRQQLSAEFAAIEQSLASFDMQSIDFVSQFTYTVGQEKAMMKHACSMISSADLLIAEVSHKAIGVGIEVGYAVGAGVPVLYVRKQGTEYSTTVGGLAASIIVYADVDDLHQQLSAFLADFKR